MPIRAGARKALDLLKWTAYGLAGAWSSLAILFSNVHPALRIGAAAAFAAGVPAAAVFFRKRRFFWPAALGTGLLVLAWHLAIRPSNDRDWSADQAVLPEIRLEGDRVTIRNLRDFEYRTPSDYTPRYYDRTFDLARLDTVDFVVERFSAWEGAGHTLLSFGFEGQEHVAVSVEIRKEKGETYSALKGCFKQFELMYVVGSERDLVGLRANARRDEVYLYPVRARREKIRALFLDVLARAARLQREPEFYHTLTNACTTNIADHVNVISPRKVPFSLKTRMAGYADLLAYELGLIETDAPLEELRRRHRINDAAAAHRDAPDFSRRIREKR
jgi:hypothetical protein